MLSPGCTTNPACLFIIKKPFSSWIIFSGMFFGSKFSCFFSGIVIVIFWFGFSFVPGFVVVLCEVGFDLVWC